METLLVTVLLPFYNAHETLDRAIQSITQQTFPSWNLILIDNNADAASKSIASRWAEHDGRIRVLHDSKQGIAFALNTGLRHVQSKYVARMDADDESLPERLAKQVDFLERNHNIGLVGCRCRFESTSDNAEGFRQFVEWQNKIVTASEHALNRFVESPLAHPSVLFRSALVEKYGGYSTGDSPEDYELWLRWMDHGVSFQKLEDELLIWHDAPSRLSRVHPNYSQDAFFETKMGYLARWLNTHAANRKIVVCGTGKAGRTRADALQQHGAVVFGFTDVKQRGIDATRFVPVSETGKDRTLFFVNFISKRGVRDQIQNLFAQNGLVEAVDYIMAA